MQRRFRLGFPAIPAVLAAVLAGCSKEPDTAPRIVSLTIVSGLGQTGFVGGLLPAPLVVRAADQNGVAVPDVQVSWSAASGGGTVSPAQTITGADGVASTTFRLGSALGQQTAQATLTGGQPVIFIATATAAPASQISIVSGDDQTAVVRTTLPGPLAVKVADAFGNAKEGITVFFTVLLGNGTLSSSTAITNATGNASVTWTLGPLASTQRVSATIAGVTPVIFDAIATPAPAAIVVVVGGNNQSAPPGALLPDSLVIRVTDQYDNPVKDVNVVWSTVGATGGTVSPLGGKTDPVGRLATAWTLGPTGGPKQARATVSGLPPAVFQAAGTIIFGKVMAGSRHTCALDEGGVAYCWGFNDAGQLGIGSVTPGSGPVFANLFPNAVVGGFTFGSGSSGASHSCAILLSSLAYCWGLNNGAQLGSGPGPALPSPTPVSGNNEYSGIVGGASHTCALTTGSRLYCWGSNAEGKLGTGSASPTPVAQPQAILPAVTIRSVGAGSLHTCAASTSGSLYCWGSNAQGQAGLGASPGTNTPTQVAGTLYLEVVAGESHTCGRRQAGDVLCWGDNSFSQLGDGTTTGRNVPTPLTGGPPSFISITAGQHHSCGLTSDGIAYCWGDNQFGQLGDATNTRRATPSPVGGARTFRMLSAGGNQTCGVTTGNVVYCWGDNQYGALGDGTQTSRNVPTKVEFQP